MKNLKRFSNWASKNWILLSTLAITIIISTINLKPGFVIMGIDNASPWFNIEAIYSRILYSENMFIYSGLIFSFPFTLLAELGIKPWLISQIFYSISMFIGLYFLTRTILYKPLNTQSKIQTITPLILISHLLFFWIFSQPTFLFLASFAGVATILFWFSADKTDYAVVDRIALPIGLLYMAMTIINPIAFFAYILEAIIILSILGKITKDILKKGFIFTLSVFLIIQGVLLFRPKKAFILNEFIEFSQIHNESKITKDVTKSLRIAETRNNALSSIVRFSGGWMELNDIEGKELFEYRSLYIRNPVFIFLGLFPVIILGIGSSKLKSQSSKRFLFLLAIASLISSSYALRIYGSLPYLRDITRWISSKTWPLLYIPFAWGYVNTLLHIETKITHGPKRKLFVALIIIMSLIYAFPVFTGKFLHRYAQVQIPNEYYELSKYNKEQTIIVYPGPQKLFTRYYDWGYYGTDFIRYITPANVIDRSQVGEEEQYDEYVRCIEEKNDCKDFLVLEPEKDSYRLFRLSN